MVVNGSGGGDPTDFGGALGAGVPGMDEEAQIAQKYGYTKEQFLARLNESEAAAVRAQRFLERNGVQVEVPALKVRTRLDEIQNFTKTEADILLLGTPFCLEVKRRLKMSFKEPENIRFPDISVDTVSGYCGKERKPLAYIMVSGDLGGGIVLPTFTESSWRVERKRDHARGIEDDFFFAAKLHFRDRRSWLVKLCRALQTCGRGPYDQVLIQHGFAANTLQKYY